MTSMWDSLENTSVPSGRVAFPTSILRMSTRRS